MYPVLLASACSLYSTSPDELLPLSGGHYNAVYQFTRRDKHAILRIGVEDCPTNQTLCMLEWVRFLYQQGAPVTAPLLSVNNHLVENLQYYGTRYTLTAFEKAEGTLAETIPSSSWCDEIFRSIGSAVGKLHRISASYQPSRRSLTRPHWFDAYEIRAATEKLATSTDPAREKLASLINELQNLPISPTDFALIHGDLHFANFLLQSDGQVTIIDFDDCVFGWFAMDVAMALFDGLVLFNAPGEDESLYFARRFLTSYLSGYRQENDITQFWLSQIPHFLKLKELCIYASLLGHPDIERPGTWISNFMHGRSARITNDLPYVDIDFAAL
jgi:Ser/Thr protein kinase RdoA (MazF antagonist)